MSRFKAGAPCVQSNDCRAMRLTAVRRGALRTQYGGSVSKTLCTHFPREAAHTCGSDKFVTQSILYNKYVCNILSTVV